VYGPNGYLAHFRGNPISGVGPEVQVSYDARRGVVSLSMSPAQPDVKLVHVHEAYSNASVTTQPGPAGAHAEFVVASSEGWFDIAIESEGNPRYLRRFAGHLEDGKPSRSDPGPRSSVQREWSA
jgi:phospholipase C